VGKAVVNSIRRVEVEAGAGVEVEKILEIEWEGKDQHLVRLAVMVAAAGQNAEQERMHPNRMVGIPVQKQRR
jgi:hypothetical protein